MRKSPPWTHLIMLPGSVALGILLAAGCSSESGSSPLADGGIAEADTAEADSSSESDATTGEDVSDLEDAEQADVTEEDASEVDGSDDGVSEDASEQDAGCPPGTVREADACVPVTTCEEGICGPEEVRTCVEEDVGVRCVCDADSQRARLLDGVGSFDTEGALPSRLLVHGQGAFPVLTDADGYPIAAASIVGDGRVYTIAHEALVQKIDSPLGVLTANVVSWMGGDDPLVIVPNGWGDMATNLSNQGFRVEQGGVDRLADADVFVISSYDELTDDAIADIEAHVRAGGGLITGGHAWWWGQSRDDEIENFPGNRTLRFAGISVSGETAAMGAYDASFFAPSDLLHATCALDAIEAHVDGVSELSDDELADATRAAGEGISQLPLDSDFFDRAEDLAESFGDVVPTREDPVVQDEDLLESLVLRVQTRLALDSDPAETRAHAAGNDFPGTVASSAPSGPHVQTILASYAGYADGFVFSGAGADVWRSTGRYAPPGAAIRVEGPESLAGSGLGVRIGAHSDRLWGRDAWERVPVITNTATFETSTVELANGFGGPIYITVPTGADLGEVDVEILGSVEMATFWHGASTNEAWQDDLASAAAPWAEFVTEHFIMTVPLSAAQQVDDPEALMALWDDVLDHAADLSGFSRERTRPERFVVDRQISGGWMHSGYPVMAHVESAEEVTSLSSLYENGAWGPFHELGHNHQWNDWVLPGTIETTCNLWSIYISENVVEISRDDAHPAVSPSDRAARIAEWQSSGGSDWSVWMALETYLQLQEEFGWDFYPELFTEYRELAPDRRPVDDADRVQQWVIRSSRAVERDLTDFYAAWGFPIEAARAEAVADLPAWTDHPMR